jgi:hypothetical protein
LKSYEQELRGRESGKMDVEDSWWAYVYPKNLTLQEHRKLIVAQTVPNLRVCFDVGGEFYLNNVHVNGILVAEATDPWFIVGVLNAPVADFVFRRIAKVKDGGFYEANKQFIAPLPIPNATAEQAAGIARRARDLQAAHTERRDKLAQLAKRMETIRRRSKPETWLFSGLTSKRDLEAEAPKWLDAEARRDWATKHYDDALETKYQAVGDRLSPSAFLDASLANGELSFSIEGVTIIDRIFENDADATFILAQWKVLATTFAITEKTTGKKLCDALRKLATNDGSPVVAQIMALERELSALDTDIARQEREMDAAVYALYGLTTDEIALVERG